MLSEPALNSAEPPPPPPPPPSPPHAATTMDSATAVAVTASFLRCLMSCASPSLGGPPRATAGSRVRSATARVEGVAKPVAEQVERHDGQEDRGTGDDHEHGVEAVEVDGLVEHPAP